MPDGLQRTTGKREPEVPQPAPLTFIILLCDEGEKYVAEHFAARDEVRVTSKTFT